MSPAYYKELPEDRKISQERTKSRQDLHESSNISNIIPFRASQASQKIPERSQEAPKKLQEAPKNLLERPQELLKESRRMLQEHRMAARPYPAALPCTSDAPPLLLSFLTSTSTLAFQPLETFGLAF